ncbi:protein toll-like [Cydia splendana]|uniref:protein toll-like n=1 Tax=Cydia splendana TaxID=1100963 RepID=UPI002142BF28
MLWVLGLVGFVANVGAASIRGSFEGAVCRPFTKCNKTGHGREDITYTVNGHAIILDFLDGHHFRLRCDSNRSGALLLSDDSEMPAMTRHVTVAEAVFNQCVIPHSTYNDALKAFNVSVTKTLYLKLPAEPRLEIRHLKGLQITNLEITAVDPTKPPRPSFDFLDEVPGLRTLKLTDVVLEPKTLSRLPTSIQILNIVNARLPAADSALRNGSSSAPRWVERLLSLRALYLAESSASLAESPGATLTPPQLTSLTNLTNIALSNVPLDTRLDSGLTSWLNGSTLKELRLQSCGLTELPSSMFEGANITKVILTYNNLTFLPNGVFFPLQWLRELDLSNNRLNGVTLVQSVAPLTRLQTLKANNNPLGSLCGGARNTFVRLYANLPQSLRRLELRSTHATRICYDWTFNNELMHIDLSYNQIGDLTYDELEMKRNLHKTAGEPVWLNLSNNSLRVIEVLPSDVKQCIEDASSTPTDTNVLARAPVQLKLNALTCDCGAYWLREALRMCAMLELEDDVPCDSVPMPARATLLAHGPDEILCPYDGFCLSECSCEKRPRDNATVVRCESALPQAPRWPPAAPDFPLALHVAPGILDVVPRLALVELHAPNNNITNIDEADIPDTLRVLDVRNNSIAHVRLAAAQLLGGEHATGKNRSVFLAGNQLACSCADAPAFSLLKRVVLDWDTTQCVDKSYVSLKTKNDLCASLLLPILFGVAVPLLTLVVAGLILQRLLPRVKQLLFKRNLCLRWILSANDKVNDPDKTHDVFLSYSYDDLERLNELKSGLEKLGYSTIEHCRDWQPGDAVMEQIARSVLCARRTLLLVSDNYAKSKWALEEFHAAHAHAMERRTARVLIVRCGLNKPEVLPSDLQLYLYNNTYLAWEDPKFWYKLYRVMPPLREDSKSMQLMLNNINPPSAFLKEDIKTNASFPQKKPFEHQLAIVRQPDTVPCAC